MELFWPFQALLYCSKIVMTVNDPFIIASLHQIFVLMYNAGSYHWPEAATHNGDCTINLRLWQQNRFCIICKQLSLWGSPDSQSCAYIYYQWFTVISQGSFFSSSCSLKAHRSAFSKQVISWESEINMIVRFAGPRIR